MKVTITTDDGTVMDYTAATDTDLACHMGIADFQAEVSDMLRRAIDWENVRRGAE
jgi:hypothetical protein